MSKISVDFEQMAEITQLMISASDDLDSTLGDMPKNLDGGEFAQVMSTLVTQSAITCAQVSNTNRALSVVVQKVLSTFAENEERAVEELEKIRKSAEL